MPTDVDRQIARSADLLRRVSDEGRSLTRRARQYRRSGIATKAKRIGTAAIAILLGAALWGGLVTPLGISGVMIVFGLLLLAFLALAMIPAVPTVRREKLAQADIKTLPLQTEIWLESQRKALPPPAVRLIDSIGTRLETLSPQLARLNPQEPAALEVRKLLADHLPELVTGYQSIPEPLRREERNGRVPEQQLIEGLSVIDNEIDRMTEQLASGDLDKLATHNRFLELKYQEARELGQ